MAKITPQTSPRDVLLSLTKEELVDWLLHRFGYRGLEEAAREARWFALDRRGDALEARIGPLLEQVREIHRPDWFAVNAEIDKVFKEMDKISEEKDLWLGI